MKKARMFVALSGFLRVSEKFEEPEEGKAPSLHPTVLGFFFFNFIVFLQIFLFYPHM